MLVSVNIEDRLLEENIINYIGDRQDKINDLMTQALKEFFQKEKPILNYKVQDIEKNTTVIDFNIKEDDKHKLFEDINDVKRYARELREDAWR